jgi:hypothetical protein
MNTRFHSNDPGFSLPSALPSVAASLRDLAVRVASRRQDRLWLAFVAVPLAFIAAVLSFQFWLIPPLIFLSWWWASRGWAWGWTGALLEAFWGCQWAVLGIILLDGLPDGRLLEGGIWITYALVVAGLSVVNRRVLGRRIGQ